MPVQNTSETFSTSDTTAARMREFDHAAERGAPVPVPDAVERYFGAPAEPATPTDGKSLYAGW